MSDEKTITINVAKEFLKGNSDIDLSDYEKLDAEAAELLATHEDNLYLGNLIELSQKAAVALAKHKGYIDLNGLTELPDDVAAALSNHIGDLELNGITVLSEKAAEALSKHHGAIKLSGLTSISDKLAVALPGMMMLADFRESLDLSGLTSLSDIAAEGLAKYNESIYLNGLTTLSDKAAEALGKHEGSDLSLDRLVELSDKAVEYLSKHKGGNYDNNLFLNGLTGLTDKAAGFLANFKGRLYLNGLTGLSDQAAEALAKHANHLYFTNLTELSEKAIAALLKHKGDLQLEGPAKETFGKQKSQSLSVKKSKNAMLRIEIRSRGKEVYGLTYPKSKFDKEKFLKEHEEDFYELSDDSICSEIPLQDAYLSISLDGQDMLSLECKDDRFAEGVKTVDSGLSEGYRDLLNAGKNDVAVFWYHDYMNSQSYTWNKVSNFDPRKIEVCYMTRRDEATDSTYRIVTEIMYNGKYADDADSYGEPKTGYEGPFVI